MNESHFDEIYGRVLKLGWDPWAVPSRTLPNQINTHHGGRGFYFLDATGHYFEVLTRSEVE